MAIIRPKVLLGLASLGAALSGYAWWHQLEVDSRGFSGAACNINATFDCDGVALSEYSSWFGSPLGYLGVAFYLFLIFSIIRANQPAKQHFVVVAVGIAVLVSMVLGFISTVILNKLCLICLGVYATNLALAVAVFPWGKGFSVGSFREGTSTPLLAVLLAAMVAYPLTRDRSQDNGVSQGEGTPPRPAGVPVLSSDFSEISINRSSMSGFGEDFRKGGARPPVTIVKFSDFECPACKGMAGMLESIHQEFGDQVEIVYKNYPLDKSCNSSMTNELHHHACMAAKVARCAGQRGLFWKFHDLAFENQEQFSESAVKFWGREVGLSSPEIESCLANPGILKKLQDDIRLGNSLGVTSTPTLYVNGRKFLGSSINDLRMIITQIVRR